MKTENEPGTPGVELKKEFRDKKAVPQWAHRFSPEFTTDREPVKRGASLYGHNAKLVGGPIAEYLDRALRR